MATIHFLAQVLLHRMQPLLENLRGRRDHRVPFHNKLLNLLEASDGVREGGDLVVADVKFDEGHEEADGVGQGFEVLKVLADVENLEVDEVLEIFRKRTEAVEASI